MADFTLSVDWLGRDCGSPAERAAFGAVRMVVGQSLLTEVLDTTAQTRRESVRVSLFHLAAWIASNWWRLRWEGQRRSSAWRMSHDMPAAGAGFLWPPVRFASHGDWITVTARPDHPNDELVRYLCDANVSVPASSFEAWTDELMALVLARLEAVGEPDLELAGLWSTVLRERQDSGLATLRRHEALLGCDPETVDRGIVTSLEAAEEWMGPHGLDEMLSVATPADIVDLLAGVRSAMDTATEQWDLSFASRISVPTNSTQPPWARGVAAARSLRSHLALGNAPLTTERLEALVVGGLAALEPCGGRVGAAFRDADGPWKVRPALRSAMRPSSRRFEVARLIGDSIVASPAEPVLALTDSERSRQKFQRSFAQEFLAPISGLEERLTLPEPTTAEISGTAAEYDISEILVVSALLNHGSVARSYVDHLH